MFTSQLHKEMVFPLFGAEEFGWSAQTLDLNLIQHLWYELEHRLPARPDHPTSVLDLAGASVAEREQQP